MSVVDKAQTSQVQEKFKSQINEPIYRPPQEKFKSQINEPIYRPPQEKGNQKYTALDGYLKGVSSGGGSDGMSGPGGDSMEK